MNAIAALTMIFLPGAFVAIMVDADIFGYKGSKPKRLSSQLAG